MVISIEEREGEWETDREGRRLDINTVWLIFQNNILVEFVVYYLCK